MDRKIVGGLYETVLNRILGFDLPNALPSARCHEVAHLTSLGISLSLLEMGELSKYDEPRVIDGIYRKKCAKKDYFFCEHSWVEFDDYTLSFFFSRRNARGIGLR
jgi:hypothetical protein